jgi:AcrR family transcriptional regulator
MSEAAFRSDRKRRAILDAARSHFLVEGYAAAGMEAIARSAGVSTATLYSYFPSKNDLFEQMVEDAAFEFTVRIPPPGRSAVGSGGVEQLRTFAVAYAGFMADPFVRSIFRLIAAERRRFTPTARHFFERGRSDFGGALMTILKRLQDEGVAEFPKLSWAAGQLMGMIDHPTTIVPLMSGDELTPERGLEQICDDAIETFMARYWIRTSARSGPITSGIEALADPAPRKVLAPES